MSELSQHGIPVEGSWRPRFALAALLRAIAYGVPLLAGSSVAWIVSRPLDGAAHRVLATVTVLGAAIVVSLLVSRLTMRLMPLAMLLRMTMIFPDRAPSRVKVARLTTSAKDIGQRLRSGSASESEAAMTMLSLVTALGRHDRHTRGHSERVRLFCDLLSHEMKLSAADAGRLRWAALIHDIGKLEIPKEILNKPAGLTDEEWAVVRRHPIDGARLAGPLEGWLGVWFAGIAHHHERWDGSGYPMGLSGERISQAGRAIAVVDAFETMTAARAYKAARSTLSARAELAMCAGSHFDPAIVRAFLAISLPKLLWSVGPLAFLVNVPYLKWVVEGGVRTADVAATATAATANAAGVTVVAVAVGALPSSAASMVPDLPSASTHAEAARGGTTSAERVGSDGAVAGLNEPRPTLLGTFTRPEARANTGGMSMPLSLGPSTSKHAPSSEEPDEPAGHHTSDTSGTKQRSGPSKTTGPAQTRGSTGTIEAVKTSVGDHRHDDDDDDDDDDAGDDDHERRGSRSSTASPVNGNNVRAGTSGQRSTSQHHDDEDDNEDDDD